MWFQRRGRFLWLSNAAVMLAVAVAACSSTPPAPSPPASAGEVPRDQDVDGDGIPDAWETNGIDYVDPIDNTQRRLDLKAMGASSSHKDILVWLTWMDANDHTHKPDQSALDLVIRAFRTAPVTNPDGQPGINLHIVMSHGMTEDPMLGSGTASNYNWTEFDAVKKTHLPPALGGVPFFAVFAHNVTAAQNSGIAKSIPGRDLVVSLGGFTNRVGTNQEKAGTLMHELGHALGLHHGGADESAFKPNYLSVMNYSFQLNGLPISGVQGNYDYSRFKIEATEASLDERVGLSNDPRFGVYGTLFYCCAKCATPRRKVQATSIVASQIDWNCDSSFGAKVVSTDINRDTDVTLLSGFDDWQAIALKPAATAGGLPGNAPGAAPEITPELADEIPLFPVANLRARRIGNGTLLEWARVPLDRVIAYRVYRAVGGAEPQVAATLEDTSNPSYADVAPGNAEARYSVTAVFAPHAYRPEPITVAGWIAGQAAINIFNTARIRTAEISKMGGVTPSGDPHTPPPPPPPPLQALRETDRSREVRAGVQ